MQGSILAVTITPGRAALGTKSALLAQGWGIFQFVPGVGGGGASRKTSSRKDMGQHNGSNGVEYSASKSTEFVTEWLYRNKLSKLKSLF